MPEHRIHRVVCELILGRSFPKVDSIIDYPAKLLGGRKHRAYLHDYPSAFIAGLLTDASLVGGLAGLTHAVTDKACSKSKQLERARAPNILG